MSDPEPHVHCYRFADIIVGERHQFVYVITPEVHQSFLSTFRDYSPIHVDEGSARARGFDGCVMHGAILNGFISHFVGMHFPGRFSLLLAVDLRFSNVSYLNDSIRAEAVVNQKMDSRQVVVLDFTLTNLTRDWVAGRGRVQVMIKELP